ncbi:hypothetical protein MMC07_000861 [Pseudocyphellaria aurata]|nr:hypothetical protein [Pseudocyphellaria aurata]
MRITLLVSGLSTLWLASPAISLPTPLAAQASLKRFAVQDDQITKRQLNVNYAVLGNDLGTEAQTLSSSNSVLPAWPGKPDDGRGSGREWDGPDSQASTNVLISDMIEAPIPGQGSGTRNPISSLFSTFPL